MSKLALNLLLVVFGAGLGLMLWPAHAQTLTPCPTSTPNLHPIFLTATALAASPFPTRTTIPLASPTMQAPTPSQEVWALYRVNASLVNVRTSPNTNAFIAGTLRAGQLVQVYQDSIFVSGNLTWGRLTTNQGWVALQQGSYVLLVKQ